MNMQLRWTAVLLLAAGIILGQAIPVFAQETEPESEQGDVVFYEDELAGWLDAHMYTGGTVRLGNIITITEPIRVYADASSPVVIDTATFGMVFDEGYIYGDYGFCHITGEGIDVPVVDVWNMGFYWIGNWNNDLLRLNVTATGRGGAGGTALRIRVADTNTLDLSGPYNPQGMIRSYGTNAVGLWLDVPMDAHCYRIEVSGQNSSAVHAPGGASLYYCRLMAEGDGAVAVTGTDVLVDTCKASPEPEDMRVIHRSILESSLDRLYLPVRQNETPDYGSLRLLNTPAFFLSGGGGFSEETRYFYVDWDYDSYFAIDTSVLGKTLIHGTVDNIFSGLGLFTDITLTIAVEVRDPALPCISMVNIVEYNGERHVHMPLWDDYDPQDENVILWCSDDEGRTWWDATHSSDIVWERGMIDFSYDALDNPVWFQLEIVGSGQSNIAVLYEKDGISYGGSGGDRTGTDRGDTDDAEEAGSGNPETIGPPAASADKENNNQTYTADLPDDKVSPRETDTSLIESLPPANQPQTGMVQADQTTADESVSAAALTDPGELPVTAIPAGSGQSAPAPSVDTLTAITGLLCAAAAIAAALLGLKLRAAKR